MRITNQKIDEAFADLRGTCGGVRNDYFGLLYLEQEFDVERDLSVSQVAFGNNDYGVDGFHFDSSRRNFYLFQFKYSESHAQFKASFQRLIDAGMERLFAAKSQDQQVNQLAQQIKSSLLENANIIDRVYVRFVFLGDPAEAERSQVLDKLREDLENKKYLLDEFFERPVSLVVEFRSASGKVGSPSHVRKTHTYSLHMGDLLQRVGPGGEQLYLGFVPLMDLLGMYREMGPRFFDRNIRGALSDDKAVNRSISQAFRRIVIDRTESPLGFPFNHNGVTLAAESYQPTGDGYRITEPRLLNGAQTITTFSRFIKANEGNASFLSGREVLEQIVVLCKVVSEATQDFVTRVTVNNNRQNPVEPLQLHANDMIQLEIQDKFRNDLGIYYERQHNAFAGLSDEDLEEQGIVEYKAVDLRRLAQTFLVSDGEIDKLSRFREVFEDDRVYSEVFGRNRLNADCRKIILCYKVQFRLRKMLKDIAGRGATKYAYIGRARSLLWALLCQGILNDPGLEEYAEKFGKGLSLEADYTRWLSSLATTKARFLISDLVSEKPYATKAADGNFSFLRTNAAYKRSMELAYQRWGWVQRRLK